MANAKHVAAVLGLVPFVIGLGAAPAFAEGNGSARGSISIENQELTDAETSNEVKVGCDFRVDFFGFDTATVPVSFTAMQPSGNGEVLEQRTVTLEDADPDGGNDFSGSLYVDLTEDLKNIEPAVAQDYDYKVRVEATVKQTAGAEITKKSMLFIVCAPEGETPPPVVTEPVVTEPVVTEPVVTEPVVTEPVVTEPVVTEPVVTEPVVTEPAVTEPAVTPAPAPAPVEATSTVETPEVPEDAVRVEKVSALAETGTSPWLAIVAAALMMAAGLVLRRFSVRTSA
ncbi:hypothetical protein [Mycetocola sp. 2940]|uniref:hypothetical protein n=1 Tax=Mycetocola sp. 2940 TaxID=3156452 RepID=UPI0033995804